MNTFWSVLALTQPLFIDIVCLAFVFSVEVIL